MSVLPVYQAVCPFKNDRTIQAASDDCGLVLVYCETRTKSRQAGGCRSFGCIYLHPRGKNQCPFENERMIDVAIQSPNLQEVNWPNQCLADEVAQKRNGGTMKGIQIILGEGGRVISSEDLQAFSYPWSQLVLAFWEIFGQTQPDLTNQEAWLFQVILPRDWVKTTGNFIECQFVIYQGGWETKALYNISLRFASAAKCQMKEMICLKIRKFFSDSQTSISQALEKCRQAEAALPFVTQD